MKRCPAWSLLLPLAFGMSVAACDDDNLVKPSNRDPNISSLTAFPSVIDRGDSILVTCEASDPDGDALVYDWFVDGRLHIKGNPPNDPDLYNSPSKTQIFYHAAASMLDSAWVECIVRDRKGGNDVQLVVIRINP